MAGHGREPGHGRRVDSVTVDPTAIPWLRLKATPTTIDGDRLAGTTYIQRIATTGGLKPAAEDCNATTAGTAREIPYTADYLFWKAHGMSMPHRHPRPRRRQAGPAGHVGQRRLRRRSPR